MGQNYIATEHVLLSLVRESESMATRILLDFDADPEKVRNEVIRVVAHRGRPRRPGEVTRGYRSAQRPSRFALDWPRASLLWRPEGLELRIPLQLNEGAMAAFAADEVWVQEPLAGMRREIWNGWLGLASPSLLDDVNPLELRRMLDGAARRAAAVRGREAGRVEDFLRALRDGA
jgi:hypothetical protein